MLTGKGGPGKWGMVMQGSKEVVTKAVKDGVLYSKGEGLGLWGRPNSVKSMDQKSSGGVQDRVKDGKGRRRAELIEGVGQVSGKLWTMAKQRGGPGQ